MHERRGKHIAGSITTTARQALVVAEVANANLVLDQSYGCYCAWKTYSTRITLIACRLTWR